MKNKIIIAAAVLLSIAFFVGSFLPVTAIRVYKRKNDNNTSVTEISKVTGKTYYVDAEAGEGNDGLTPEKALKTLEEVNRLRLEPGDQVLFKKGCRWNGGLIIAYSGEKEKPIIYDAYGTGDQMPIINGSGDAYAAIYGVDVSYISIRNLEITNVSNETDYLRGIFINALHKNVEGIKVINNYIHNIDSSNLTPWERDVYNIGNAWSDYHWIGGIIIRAGGYSVHEAEKDEQVILNDILVEGNTVEQVAIDGITVGSVTKSWKKSTGVIVKNNVVNKCAGDGILVFACNGSLIEGNKCDGNGWSGPLRNDLNFVGIFIIYCNDTVIQYNEVSNQNYCTDDGQAFDVDDTCTNSLVQYNYSHNNANGFLLLFNMNNNGHVTVRYNISQNDGGPFITVSCLDSSYPMVMTADVYNNTCFTNKQLTEMLEIVPNSDMRKALNKRIVLNVYNNIFFNKGIEGLSVLNNDNYYSYINFSNNCWYGFSERTLPEIEPDRIYANPGLCKPGSDTTDGYKLLKNSPCLKKGKQIFNDGGLDFFGNKIGDAVNIGAYYGNGENKPDNTNLALNQPVAMSSVGAIAMLREATMVKAVDGDDTEVVTTKPTDSADAKEWFEIDLEDNYNLKKVLLHTGKDSSLFPKSFSIDIWNGKEWKTVVSKKNYKTPEEMATEAFSFKETKGSKVRINITAMNQNASGKYAAGLSEIEVY